MTAWKGRRFTVLAALALALGLATSAAADVTAHKVDKSHSRIGFLAHTSLFDVNGRFKRWSAKAFFDPADLTKSKITLTVDTKSVDTDSDGRDGHLRREDFFYVEKFPKAKFVSKSFQQDGSDFSVTGDLTIRGVTKSVTVPFVWTEVDRHTKRKGGVVYTSRRAKGKVTVNRKDYGINYKAGLLLPSVKDNVDITFDVNFFHPDDKKGDKKGDKKADGGKKKAG
jgi:polyisoprenoid-binding protein YceI